MRASEFITELFQPGKNWQWEFRGSEEVAAQFNVDKHAYRFHAFDDDGTWEVEFALSDNKDDDDRPLSSLGKYGLTGTGNAAEVMSIVADIMRSFLSEYDDKITALKFSANEPSRKALYLRMIKRLLPNWRVSPDEFDDNGFIVFRANQLLKQGVAENFADGKVKGKSRPGRVKRAGASCEGSVTELRAKAKNASGEKAKMYHWCANMKAGKQK
jgi:hypothetical protein